LSCAFVVVSTGVLVVSGWLEYNEMAMCKSADEECGEAEQEQRLFEDDDGPV
jgi:hypothetical protein